MTADYVLFDVLNDKFLSRHSC